MGRTSSSAHCSPRFRLGSTRAAFNTTPPAPTTMSTWCRSSGTRVDSAKTFSFSGGRFQDRSRSCWRRIHRRESVGSFCVPRSFQRRGPSSVSFAAQPRPRWLGCFPSCPRSWPCLDGTRLNSSGGTEPSAGHVFRQPRLPRERGRSSAWTAGRDWHVRSRCSTCVALRISSCRAGTPARCHARFPPRALSPSMVLISRCTRIPGKRRTSLRSSFDSTRDAGSTGDCQ